MKRVAAYSRVSTTLQATDGMSLDAQERAIKEYCQRQGWPEPALYVDAGRSAYKEAVRARPVFAQLLRDVAAGLVDVVVVWHLNRWARRTAVTLGTLQQLDKAGVPLISVSQHLDYSSAVGKLTITMLAGIAQFESDEKSETAKRVHADLRAQGKWDGGSPPYGARRGEDGKLTLDDEKAETLALMLDLVATVSYHAAADELNERGIPPPGASRRYVAGAPRGWWPTSLRNVVKAGAWLLDQPEPWPERWRAAWTRPTPLPVARSRTVRMLTGLMRCHGCGHAVVYSWDHRKDNLRVRCETPGCRVSYSRAWRHEDAVLARAMALTPREEVEAAPGVDTRAIEDIGEQRRRYLLMFGDLRITEQEYRSLMADLDAREAVLVRRVMPGRDLGDATVLLPHLASASPSNQNRLLRLLIARVEMLGKDERRIIWRPDVAAAFAGCE